MPELHADGVCVGVTSSPAYLCKGRNGEPRPPSSSVSGAHPCADCDKDAKSNTSMDALLLSLTQPFSDESVSSLIRRRSTARLRARLDLPNEITRPTNVALISMTAKR